MPHYAELHYAVIMQSVIMLRGIMSQYVYGAMSQYASIIILNVFMLNVVTPTMADDTKFVSP